MKFIEKYFIDPIIYKTGYNIINTISYALLFILISFLIYKMIPKKVKIDKKLFFSSIPFILLGSTLRVLEDASILKNFLFVTPMIWILLAFYAVTTFFISLTISNHLKQKYFDKYYKIWPIFGIIPLLFFITAIRINYPIYLLKIILAAVASCSIAYLISVKFNFMTESNMNILFVHMFDASTTYTALSTGNYFEEHVVGSLFTNIFGPIGMYILKLPVLLLVFWQLEKYKDKRVKNYIYLLILILGLGPGTRNMLRLIMGV